MRLTSMLMNSGTFGIVEWCIVGVLAVILLIAFLVGYKKGVSNLNLRPISWVFGCAAFLLLEAFLHDQCFINALIPIEDPALSMDAKFSSPTQSKRTRLSVSLE